MIAADTKHAATAERSAYAGEKTNTGQDPAPAADAAPANATKAENASNVTANVSVPEGNASNVTGCATKEDSRIAAWFTETAPAGAVCVFGVDARDEGSHCIYSEGKYGSNGWCYTTEDHTEWGSCNDHCPLYGAHEKLAKKIDAAVDMVANISRHLEAQLNGTAPQNQGGLVDAAAAVAEASATTAA